MKRLQKCCCCASTRTGTLITATLGIILSIATIIIVWVVQKHRITFSTFIFDEDFDKKLSDLDIPRIILTVNLCFTILICTLLFIAVQKVKATGANEINARMIVMMVCQLFRERLPSDSQPWEGILRQSLRRSWLMLPWVVLGIVLAIGLLISVLHTSITYYLDDSENHILLATIILVGGLLYLCLYLYLWAVVFSHYLDTRDEEERGRYRKAPYRR